jgi:DNA-directed RNA polymerase subunit F
MIKEMKPLSLAETKEIVETAEDTDDHKEIRDFLKRFTKLKPEKAKEMREELKGLGIIKLKEEHIVKIIDLLPEDAEDVNKIAIDVSLDENEISKLLEVVKKYK